MKILKFTYFLLLTFCLAAFNVATEDKNSLFLEEEVKFSQEELGLASEIIKVLEDQHFTKKKFITLRNESFRIFTNNLDPNKSIFILSDLEIITPTSQVNKLDVEKDIDIAYKIFNIYKERYVERHNYQTKILEILQQEDLNQEKVIQRDRSDNKNEKSISDLQELWSDLILNDLIQLILNGNSLEEAKLKITKRQNNQFNFFQQTRSEDVFNLYANAITASFGPHTSYMSPQSSEDFDINMSLSLEGIGALLSSDGMYTTINSLVAGGPAEKSNTIKPKDKIISIGQEGEEELTDVVGWRIDDVVKLIRGPKGTKVRLEIIPASSLDESETKIIDITRNLVNLEDQAAEKDLLIIDREEGQIKIGVINLPAFYFDFTAYQKRDYDYRSSSKDVKKLIRELKEENIDGLILDLRNNGGGSLYEANSLAHLFLGRGTTVQIKNANGNIQSLGEKWGYQYYDGPLLVLVNKFSASASEILAGAIQDYDRGLVVGTDTFGKGTVQKVDDLSTGQIKLTESKFYRVTGSSTQHKGVTPDIHLPSVLELDEFGESQLEGALIHDVIIPTKYKDFKRVKSAKKYLVNKSLKRIMNSPLFLNLEQKKQWRNSQKVINLDLDIDKRRDRKSKTESELLVLENSLREDLSLPLYVNYQEYLDDDRETESIDIDIQVLNESANILGDFIELSEGPIIAAYKGE